MVQLDKTQKMSSEDRKAIREMLIIMLIILIMAVTIFYLGVHKKDFRCMDGMLMYHSGDMWIAESPIIPCKEALEDIL